ncbi:MAG: acyltransferase family protein [Succinivibrio sp.]|nr:acyltransferase family protein [Succinivibrio sp.]
MILAAQNHHRQSIVGAEEPRHNKTRVDWLDLAKFIGMILVIVGHSLEPGGGQSLPRGIIFSFHMPLFFLLSGLVFAPSQSPAQYARRLKKSFRRLIVPALVTYTGILVLIHLQWSPLKLADLRNIILTLTMFSGTYFTIYGITVPPSGPLWFLCGLFIARAIFDALHLFFDHKQFVLYCLALSVLGVTAGYAHRLPFNLDIALSILPLLLLGYYLKHFDFDDEAGGCAVLCLLVWGLTLFITFPYLDKDTYMDIAMRKYPFFPICFVCATAASLFVFYLCRFLLSSRVFRVISSPALFFGRHSLALFCFHCLDMYLARFWKLTDILPYNILMRISLDLAATLVFVGTLALLRHVRGEYSEIPSQVK